MKQQLCRRRPQFGVFLETLKREVDGACAKLVLNPSESRLAVAYSIKNSLLALRKKRRTAGQKDVCYNANAPNVYLAVIGLVIHDFWSQIHRTPQSLLKPFDWIAKCREAKISKFHADFAVLRVLRD